MSRRTRRASHGIVPGEAPAVAVSEAPVIVVSEQPSARVIEPVERPPYACRAGCSRSFMVRSNRDAHEELHRG